MSVHIADLRTSMFHSGATVTPTENSFTQALWLLDFPPCETIPFSSSIDSKVICIQFSGSVCLPLHPLGECSIVSKSD